MQSFKKKKNVGKGENAAYQHLLLFPPCFQMSPFSGMLRRELFGKALTPYHKIPILNNPKEGGFGKYYEKRRKCWLPPYVLFLQCFLTYQKEKSLF